MNRELRYGPRPDWPPFNQDGLKERLVAAVKEGEKARAKMAVLDAEARVIAAAEAWRDVFKGGWDASPCKDLDAAVLALRSARAQDGREEQGEADAGARKGGQSNESPSVEAVPGISPDRAASSPPDPALGMPSRETAGWPTREPHPIEKIRNALLRILKFASGETTDAYMSIPADWNRDADLILTRAIDELEASRAALTAAREENERLERIAKDIMTERDAARAQLEAVTKERDAFRLHLDDVLRDDRRAATRGVTAEDVLEASRDDAMGPYSLSPIFAGMIAKKLSARLTAPAALQRETACSTCGATSREDERGRFCSNGFHGPVAQPAARAVVPIVPTRVNFAALICDAYYCEDGSYANLIDSAKDRWCHAGDAVMAALNELTEAAAPQKATEISDEELAVELETTYLGTEGDYKQSWLAVARRARELLGALIDAALAPRDGQ